MGHVGCSNLAYAHPGGDFCSTASRSWSAPASTRASSGPTASARARCCSSWRASSAEDGEIRRRARGLHGAGRRRRRQGAHGARAAFTLAPAAHPHRRRAHARRRARARRGRRRGRNASSATAIGEWSELGGYELEGQWEPPAGGSCARRSPSSPTGPADTLSGGERKRLVLDVLFASDADVLLLDEPDNFLDIPAKRALEPRSPHRARRCW